MSTTNRAERRRLQMTIDATQRKTMAAGMVLVATYKKEEHRAEVVAGEDEKLRYRLADGTAYRSPSAAGSAVMGGVACHGWRFWRVAGAATPSPGDAPSDRKSTRLNSSH